jgi:hypothetical protein
VRPISRWAGHAARWFGVAALGCILSLALYQVWELPPRWSAIVIIAAMAVAVSMCLVHVFSDLLLVASLFCLPIASFVKWFAPSGYAIEDYPQAVLSGLYNVGVIDFILVGLYVSWFSRVFVTCEEALPRRFNPLDGFVLWLIAAHVLATFGSVNPSLGFSATAFHVKYALFYFYLSRHLEERHLPWLVAAFMFTIVVEAVLGSYQFATGRLVGLSLDKGHGDAQILNSLTTVPGQGSYHRATGTLTEPHVFGEFAEMLLPFFGVLFLTPRLRPGLRVLSLVASGCAALMILFSLSRGAYIGAAVSLALGVVLILALWRERQVVPALAIVVLLTALAAPFIANLMVDRLTRSLDTLTGRYPVYWSAVRVFTDYPLFGVGPGNWMYAYPRYDQQWLILDSYSNLIHNDILLTAAELGVFGVVPYLIIILSAMLRLFTVARRRRDVAGRLALAALMAMTAAEVNNQVDPGIHEPSISLLFWIVVSLSVILPRLRPGAGAILMAPSGPRGRPLQAPGMAARGAAGWDGE